VFLSPSGLSSGTEELKVDVLYTPELCDIRSQNGDYIAYHYVGRLLDGSEFDCSFNYNQPYKFTLGRREVIQGMDRGLQGTCIGDRLKITIPPSMAYGERGVGEKIPPNSTLVFYVDVLSIKRDGVTLSPIVTSDQLLYTGTNAYSSQKWQECVDVLEQAIVAYKEEQDKLFACQTQCRNSTEIYKLRAKWISFSDSVLLDQFYHLFKLHQCAKQCKAQLYGKHKSYSSATASAFETRTVYSYLQLCYYRLGQVEDARVAAETFYDFNVDSELGLHNMKFYGSLRRDNPPEYNPREISMEHMKLYSQGQTAYSNSQFSTAINKFEAALKKFYGAVWKCQLKCLDNFTESFDEDLDNELGDDALMIAARYVSAYVLCCKKCVEKLTFYELQPGKVEQNYASSHYNYLQFCYYQMGDNKNASQCAGTYILMLPDDDAMKENIRYYKSQTNIVDSDFNPRQDAYDYFIEQMKLEILWKMASIPRSTVATLAHGLKGDRGEYTEETKKHKQTPVTHSR
jgi:hypothetical protein